MSQRKTQNIKWKKSSKEPSTIGVYLRIRPLKAEKPTIEKINDQQIRTLPPDNSTPEVYSFTKVFDNASQSQIFKQVAQPILEDFILSARDGLIFTYGITGSGKTYTMEGNRNDPGLIFRSIDFIFNSIAAQQTPKHVIESDSRNSYRLREEPLYPNLGRLETPSALPSVIKWRQRAKEPSKVSVDHTKYFTLFISLIELYNKQVHDLLEDMDPNTSEKKKREIRSDQRGLSYVANVVEVEVKSAEEAVDIYTRGIRRRKIGATALNQESSRGHCVLNLRLVQLGKSIYDGQFDENTLVSSQLCLVDLAGSERTKRSGATGGALFEAGSINNSLGALRKCIRALRDREPTNNIQYREHSLTRLFKSYFEGHGFVRMVLCVKPSVEDFYENNTAMEFGLLSQEVYVDYASPPKMIKRSRTQEALTAGMLEYLDKKTNHLTSNSDLVGAEFIADWITKLKQSRDERKKCMKVLLDQQQKFRSQLVEMMDQNATIKEKLRSRAKEREFVREERKERRESLTRRESHREVKTIIFNPSTESGMTGDSAPVSNESPTQTDSSLTMVTPVPEPRTLEFASGGGVPVVNPRHNRSLSCSSMQWIHHKPQGTIDTGTVLKPKFKNGRSVKNLRSSDILRKDAAGYSVVHQDADPNGDVETSIYKGHIISTVCGGAQVILNDIETMRQVSPKRRRAASDAQFTH